MKRKSFLAATLLSLIFLTSCGNQGGGSILEDPPDCYYDSLFGCGTFDIPSDSSYYGRSQIKTNQRSSFAKSSNLLKGTLDRRNSSCSVETPRKLTGNIEFKQLKDRVTLKVPIAANRYLSMRGKTEKKGFSTTSTGLISLCRYSSAAQFRSKNNKKNYAVNLNIKLNCLFQKPCEINFSGTVVR